MKTLVKFYNLKAKYEISDTFFSEMLLLVGSMLPQGNTFPSSFSEAKKSFYALVMEYEKIHVCPNDCLLYRGERDEDETKCRICQASRWKLNKKGDELEGIPAKVLWYFPFIPRLRNLFNSPQTSKDLTWHDGERLKDGKLRHPADAQTWKEVDARWPDFPSDPRNLRDYPAYGNLSGNIIKGYNGCPICVNQTKATRLVNYCKCVVMRHRRWLPRHHPYRRKKQDFDNTVEKKIAPVPLTREEVRHVLDVMHIEKNICESLLGTMLNIPKKMKDKESVRIDMAEMGIRTELRSKTPGEKQKLPLASWNLTHFEKSEHMAFLMTKYSEHENDEMCLKNKQNETFPKWFKEKIASNMADEKEISAEIRWIADEPNKDVPTFSGYRMDGVTFSTKDRDDMRQVQCSGVCVEADTMVVQAKHVKQVCYIDDPSEKLWSVVLKLPEKKYHEDNDDADEVLDIFDNVMANMIYV
ncbi:hypothetical protein AgCh_001187 [Apium graveolens]